MTYGLNTGAFIEDGPAAAVIEVQASRPTARAWRALDPERRGGKRQKDLADIARILEQYPSLRTQVPPEIRALLLDG